MHPSDGAWLALALALLPTAACGSPPAKPPAPVSLVTSVSVTPAPIATSTPDAGAPVEPPPAWRFAIAGFHNRHASLAVGDKGEIQVLQYPGGIFRRLLVVESGAAFVARELDREQSDLGVLLLPKSGRLIVTDVGGALHATSVDAKADAIVAAHLPVTWAIAGVVAGGRVHVCYSLDDFNGKTNPDAGIWYAVQDGSAWKTERVGEGQDCSIAVDAKGDPLLEEEAKDIAVPRAPAAHDGAALCRRRSR